MCEYKLHCEWGEIRNERFLNEISEYALFTYIQFIYLFIFTKWLYFTDHSQRWLLPADVNSASNRLSAD